MASVPYEYECAKESGFIPDPNEHKRCGYITALSGFNLTAPIKLDADLQVFTPYNNPQLNYSPATPTTAGSSSALGKLKVVGVIEKFAWNGGVGDPLQIDFYVSQQNAVKLKTAQQSTLTSSRVDTLGWWIINFDQELKKWFEQSYPTMDNPGGLVTGIVGPQDNPELNVDLNGVPAKDGIDVMVYKVSIQVAPGANQMYTLNFANSANMNNVKSWGLVVGSWAAASY